MSAEPGEPAMRLTGQLVVMKMWPLETKFRVSTVSVRGDGAGCGQVQKQKLGFIWPTVFQGFIYAPPLPRCPSHSLIIIPNSYTNASSPFNSQDLHRPSCVRRLFYQPVWFLRRKHRLGGLSLQSRGGIACSKASQDSYKDHRRPACRP